MYETKLPPETQAEHEPAQRTRGKRILLAIVGVAALPVVLAYTMFFSGIGVPTHTVNNGLLLAAPKSIESIVSDATWQRIQQEKKWRILLPLEQSCLESCQQGFYTTRQVHIRLGEKSTRLERIALNSLDEAGLGYLQSIAQDHPLMEIDSVPPGRWQQWREDIGEVAALANGHYYYFLVDQEGIAMMLYTDQHGNDLLKDIKRALKYSIDYQ